MRVAATVWLTVVLLTSAAAQNDCRNCHQDFCSTVNPPCCVIEGLQTSTCNCNTSVIQCQGSSTELFPVVDDCTANTTFNTSLADGSGSGIMSNGFYIIIGHQFCTSACFDKITLHSDDSSGILKFHIYKRYSNPERSSFRDGLFVEQTSFNVTLSLVEGSDDALEANVTNPLACFDSGDYLGLSIGQDLQIKSITNVEAFPKIGQGARYYDQPPLISNCTSNSTVLELTTNGEGTMNELPLMTVIYKEFSESTPTPVITTPETTPIGTDTRTTEMNSSETRIVTDTTMPKPDPPESSTNTNVSLIVGVLITTVAVIAILVTIIVIFFRYFRYLQHSRQVYLEKVPDIKVLDQVSMDSMNSASVNYHENNVLYQPAKETVVNPYADSEENLNHHYHEPFEMNDGANARSRLWQANAYPYQNGQVQPAKMVDTSEAVNNIHYGVPSALFGMYNESASPTYQNPDELAGTPRMLNRRGTIPNALYSTPEEFGVRTMLNGSTHLSSTDGQVSPIYNEPFELEAPPSLPQQPQLDSPFARPHAIPAVRIGVYDSDFESDSLMNGSRDSLDHTPNHLAFEYSLPITNGTDKASNGENLLAFSQERSQSHENHMLGEVTGQNNHHYHLLDDEASQGGYTTDEDEDFTASRVHHVVNQPGAYVPNSEERRELYNGDTLRPASLESWKKSSFKRGKFFVRHEKFWVPSQNKAILFDQLSQKKFREIFKDNLEIKSHIGSGQFGSVQKAKMKLPSGDICVAVKIMKPSIIEDAPVKFLQEAAIMGQFFHPNIIELFGIVSLNKPLMIVLEYMSLGDLHSYLHKHYRSSGAAPPQAVTLLKFCRQVVHGMTYLAGKHFVHRDLAARNVFVSSTLICKIGDFGMSRNLMDEEYYKSHGGVVPIKWTAPEGLLYKKYSSASDVYSYGMTMFEIWSLGEKPLRDVPIQNVAKTMADGYCQPSPPGTPREIYKVMVQCWNPEQSKRVNFEDISEVLARDDENLLSWSESDPEESSAARLIGSPLEDGHALYKDLQNTYNPASSEMTK